VKNLQRCRLTVAISAIVAATAQGSEITPQDSKRLEETVVTASRSAQRVFDSHASLSVITEEDLARTTVPSVAELLRDLPGVQVTDSGQPGQARIRIRGEESRRTAVLINGQEVTDHHEVGTPLTLHPSMLERVELVRGSGSVLYGSRALSGVVNFITRKGGTEPFQATLAGGYSGATNGYDSFASVFGNVQGFEYRLAWSQSDHEERETPAGKMENTAFDHESAYLYTGKDFGHHRLEYVYENHESSSGIYVEEEVKTNYPLTDFYLETPQRDREKHGLFYQWDVDNSFLKTLSANGFRQISDRHFYTYTEIRMSSVGYDRDINSFSELITEGALMQLDFQQWGGHSVIAGVQYLDDEIDQTRHVDTLYVVPPIPLGTEVIRDKASIETWALYVQDQWEINDSLTLTAGLRQYQVEGDLEYSDRESLTAGGLDDDEELIGALGLVWSVNDQLHLRANVAEGYVYPSLMQLATGAYAGSRFVNPDPDLDPETSMNYELGLRMQNGGLTLDATAFYSESEDYIHHLPCTAEDNCPGSRDHHYTNIGESSAYGLELYTAYTLGSSGLESYASLTWMERENEYEEFTTTKSGIPELAGRVGVRWQGPLWSIPRLWTDFYLRGESSSELEEPGTTRDILEDKDSWTTINLATGLHLGANGQYQLALELLNLTDEEYIASTENLYGAERSVAMKLTLNW
jgi:hemoglobin/transferrin/lactoferrin receptor protein